MASFPEPNNSRLEAKQGACHCVQRRKALAAPGIIDQIQMVEGTM
jgi:hypothetical protein